MRIGIVGCGATKKPYKCEAQELYCGGYFVKTMQYVKATCDKWLILSAYHGLIEPTKVLAPYDVRVEWLTPEQRKRWSNGVKAKIRQYNLRGVEVIMLANLKYRKPFNEMGVRYTDPAKGLKMGQKMQFMTKVINQHRVVKQ